MAGALDELRDELETLEGLTELDETTDGTEELEGLIDELDDRIEDELALDTMQLSE